MPTSPDERAPRAADAVADSAFDHMQEGTR
jgi:hypothetical protein